jgi:tetratricopeptide (TPR) repeat protein
MNMEVPQDRIQNYISGKMSLEEKADFEKQIAASETLSEEVHRFRQLRIITQHKDLWDAHATLKSVMETIDIEPDYGEYEQDFKTSFWKNGLGRWFWGGLIALTVTGSIWGYQKHQQKTALYQLAQTHLQPLEILIGFSPNDHSQEARGMQAYQQGNYAAAIPLLNEALQKEAEDNALRLYLAISYLMQAQHAKAETLFHEILKTQDLQVPSAQWYLALSLLQRGEKDAARTLLQNLESNKTFDKRVQLVLKNL